jgi:hypothetical protein
MAYRDGRQDTARPSQTGKTAFFDNPAYLLNNHRTAKEGV